MALRSSDDQTREPVSGRVLVVDDDDELLALVQRRLQSAGYDVSVATSAAEALSHLTEAADEVDVLVTDLGLPHMDGFALLATVQARYPDLVVVIMTGRGTVDTAVKAMREGAHDFVVKPFDPPEALIRAIAGGVQRRRLEARNRYLERELERSRGATALVGGSPPMVDLLTLVSNVARTTATVLIQGESGTGKELVAREIHRQSPRRDRPFVAINCGALSEAVLESELFGHVRGAFTGAISSRRGLFEEASGGTLFLDEVGELAPSTQVRLLRVLQEGEIRAVGSNEARSIDVRVVGATHRNLATLIAEGRFRQDLFYRINVVSVHVPALRDRPDDLPALTGHFIAKHQDARRPAPPRITTATLEVLAQHDWPGNVRELENAVQRALVMTSGDIEPEHLPPEIQGIRRNPIAPARSGATLWDVMVGPPNADLPRARLDFERRYLRRALELAAGNTAEAARLAGLDRSNFRKLLRRHGLEAARFRPQAAR